MESAVLNAVADPKSEVRLFRAWSIISDWRGIRGAYFLWFAERPEPTGLSSEGDGIASELFTEFEVDELRRYLRETHNSALMVSEAGKSSEQPEFYLTGECSEQPKFYYPLSQVQGYALSVPISGFLCQSGEWAAEANRILTEFNSEQAEWIGRIVLQGVGQSEAGA